MVKLAYIGFIKEIAFNVKKPFCFLLIVMLELNINEKLILSHNFRYYRGLANMMTNDISEVYNKSFMFGIGLKMKLNP
jgi:hypothetical protein